MSRSGMVVAFPDSGRPQFESLRLQISKKFSSFERTKKKQGLSFQPRSVWTQNILANDTKYNPEKSSIKSWSDFAFFWKVAVSLKSTSWLFLVLNRLTSESKKYLWLMVSVMRFFCKHKFDLFDGCLCSWSQSAVTGTTVWLFDCLYVYFAHHNF